ncbi:hypothetical protein [Actinomadura sp. CNU-125]|uniref:hypothetical protein n=1 Tax=Actinomadura sp. CNU-125 TaxID=1904961 RepID=UPI0013010860|nr:hypothetical protein [Actinomadura sp. CNU-125]
MHRIKGRHVWRLALDDGQGRRPATVHLMCRPCRITKPLQAPAHPVVPCFCRNATCARWQQYIARWVALFGVAPNLDDIAVDEQWHASTQQWLRDYGAAWRRLFFVAVLGNDRREVTG